MEQTFRHFFAYLDHPPFILMETLRRLIFAITIFVLASLAFSFWRRGQEGYGLINLLKGESPKD